MLYAIIILSILVVILLLCIGVLLYGMKNNKRLSMEYLEMMMSQRKKLFPWSGGT